MIDHDGTGPARGRRGRAGRSRRARSTSCRSGRWIGQTGTDGQVYGIVYDDAEFLGYAAGIWCMSQRRITLAPGASFVLGRDVVALRAGASDPWSPLDAR